MKTPNIRLPGLYGAFAAGLLFSLTGACADTAARLENYINSNKAAYLLSQQAFESQAYLETYHGHLTGVYIVDGDTPANGKVALQKFYHEYVNAFSQLDFTNADVSGFSTVYSSNGVDNVWNATQKLQLTYCISDAFGARKADVVQAMADATAAYEAEANLDFTYVPAQDAACSAGNLSVMFDVELTSGQSYLARSFFPNYERQFRNLMIDGSSFSTGAPLTLTGILRHELGHTLGLRHEHTRPEAGVCFEDSLWRTLTSYDASSVMHYPQCNGTGDWSLTLTALDKQGIVSIYGAASLILPHVIVTGSNSLNVDPVVSGGGYLNIQNNGAYVQAVQVGTGTIMIVNNGSVVTATNTGTGLMSINNAATAAVTVTNSGNGNTTVNSSGQVAIVLTHSGDDDYNFDSPAILPPTVPAQAMLFSDLNAITGEISGDLAIVKAINESNILGYNLYWGNNSTTKAGAAIASIGKTGTDLAYHFNSPTLIPAGVTHFLVFTQNSMGEMPTGISVKIRDVFTLNAAQLSLPANFQTTGFGWDWDMEAPHDSALGGAPPDANFDFASGAFISDVVGGASTTRKYTSLRIYPQALFGNISITLGDIQRVSYWTRQKSADGLFGSTAATDRAWQMKIYTVNPTAATWYKTRLNTNLRYFETNDWKVNSTDSSLNFTDSQGIHDKVGNVYLPYTTLGSGTGSWADMRTALGPETVLFIDFIAGSSTPAPVIDSYLDGIVIELTNGKKIALDLE